jgi:hypothetical protein
MKELYIKCRYPPQTGVDVTMVEKYRRKIEDSPQKASDANHDLPPSL